MRVVSDDKDTLEFVDNAAMSFMALTTHRLNETLIANGVADAETRQAICASFLFEFSYHHDAGWLTQDARQLYPMVCFAERLAPTKEENLGAIDVLHVPTPASSWHEYAHGVVSQYFEDSNESVDDIDVGSYHQES